MSATWRPEAHALYRDTIPAWRHLGSRGAIANQLESFAFLALARGDRSRAATLFGGAGELPPGWEEGRRLSADEAVAFALSGSSQSPAQATEDVCRPLRTGRCGPH